MVHWDPPRNLEVPRWQAVALVFLLGATVAFVAAWYSAKAWLG